MLTHARAISQAKQPAAATNSEITSDYMRLSLKFMAAHRGDVQKNTYSIHFSVEKNKFLFSIGFL